ncbi:hypothetical protein AGMMS49928_08790 [Spirochaetia bacterium]|nr:hypothetical protein AGMMS49928_08790 [Spirochaetia bacterium]
MNDLEESEGLVPANVLSKQGMRAVGGIVGGAALFVARILPWIVSVPLGIIAAVVGLSALRSRDRSDHLPGLIITATGALTVLAKLPAVKFLWPVAGTLLGIGTVGLFALGIWNAVKFFIGLKRRS